MCQHRRKYFYENFYDNKFKREERKHLRRRNEILNSTGEDIGEFNPPQKYKHIERVSYTNWLMTRSWRECNRRCNESFNEGKYSDSGSDIYHLNKMMHYDSGEYAVNGIRFSYEYILDTFSVYVGYDLIYTAKYAESADCDIPLERFKKLIFDD